jgi:predicted amidohydrolase YtcJ
MTQEELREEVKRSLEAGLDVATHAIGDEAVRRVLTLYESVLSADAKLSPRRLRIEHFSYASPADREQAARLGVVLVIQPGFVYPCDDGRTMEDSRLGEKRSKDTYAWRQLSELGAVLAGSSDDFSELPHPLWNFYAAVTRKNPAGQPTTGWHLNERLARDTSLRLFTALFPPGGGAAKKGELRTGGPANLVILSGNPLTSKEEHLLQLKVHATLRDGQVTFHDGSLEGLR